MVNAFNIEKLKEQLKKVSESRPISPTKDEIRYTATSVSEFGLQATVHFILRDGEMIFYDKRNDRYITEK